MRPYVLRRIALPAFVLATCPAYLVASCAESAAPQLEEPPAPGSTSDATASIPDTGCAAGNWCRVALPRSPVAINGIWGSGPDDVWMAGSPAVVLHWDGRGLEAETIDTGQSLFGVWGSGGGDVWTFSTSASVWHRDASGGAWSRSTGESGRTEARWPPPIAAMWGSSATDVWAVGMSFELSVPGPIEPGPIEPGPGGPGSPNPPRTIITPSVFRSEGWQNGDPNWKVSPTSPSTPSEVEPITFNAICGSQKAGVWIVGSGGKTRHTSGWMKDGAAWHSVNSQTSRELYAAWCAPSGGVWAAGEGGTIRRFAFSGGDRSPAEIFESPARRPLRAIWGVADDDIWAVGDGGTILHFDGQSWTLAEGPLDGATKEDLFAIWGTGENDVWIAGRDVLLHKSSVALPGDPL